MLHQPKHIPSYPQAEPPEPITCLVYVLVFVFILGTIIWIGIKLWMESH